MIPKPRNSKSANYACYLVKRVGAMIGHYGRELVAEADIIRDVSRMARANDLAYLTVQAELDSSVRGTWLGLVNEKRYQLLEPFPPASDVDLYDCDFRLHVYRMGREARYEKDLCLHWTPGSIYPERPYAGVVEVVPGGPRRGRIRSGPLVFELLRRDARDLKRGDDVVFAAARYPGTGQLQAFLVTKAGDGDEPRSSSDPVPPIPGNFEMSFAMAEGAGR